MAKKQPKARESTREVWEYEHLLRLPGEEPEMVWIPEDDERSASYKALREGSTGNIRSQTQKIRTTKGDVEILERSEWSVKVQNLVTPKTD